MAVSYTYGTMQSRIADELGGRSDLMSASTGLSNSPIQLAIQTAINYYDNEDFWFNQLRTSGAFTTVRSQEFYTNSDWAQMSTLHHIDQMSILIAGNRFQMYGRTGQQMEKISMNASWVGQPVLYSYYAEQIRLYPIPDAAYPVNILYTENVAELVNADDTNIWVNEAEPMIRARAKYYLYRDTLLDPQNAVMQAKAAQEEYATLKQETNSRSATNFITPTSF